MIHPSAPALRMTAEAALFLCLLAAYAAKHESRPAVIPSRGAGRAPAVAKNLLRFTPTSVFLRRSRCHSDRGQVKRLVVRRLCPREESPSFHASQCYSAAIRRRFYWPAASASDPAGGLRFASSGPSAPALRMTADGMLFLCLLAADETFYSPAPAVIPSRRAGRAPAAARNLLRLRLFPHSAVSAANRQNFLRMVLRRRFFFVQFF